MIVKCIYNNYNKINLPHDLKNYLNDIHPKGIDKILPLIVNKIYICYALTFGPFLNWVFLIDETGSRYPSAFPQVLFSFIDRYVSKYWVIGEHVDYKNNRSSILAFQEWADNENFHGDLFEGNRDALSTFEFYKDLMDVEFSRPDITDIAEPLDKPYWVFDVESEESWESNPFDAIIRVPNTKRLINNPYYKRPKRWTS